jgi:hypothetical protein
MFTNIIAWFTRLFAHTHQTQLDQYIQNRRPTSVADVEYLERQYSKLVRRGLV